MQYVYGLTTSAYGYNLCNKTVIVMTIIITTGTHTTQMVRTVIGIITCIV